MFLGDKGAVWKVEHHTEDFSSGSASAQPTPRLHGPSAERSHTADGVGEAGGMGWLPRPGAVSVQDVHQPHDKVHPLRSHV